MLLYELAMLPIAAHLCVCVCSGSSSYIAGQLNGKGI